MDHALITAALAETMRSLAAAFLGFDVRPADHEAAPPGRAESLWTGYVTIRGPWRGKVHLDCSNAFARRAAASWFDVQEEAVRDADVRDLVGELTNIVGGNLKAHLSGACAGESTLSLPNVDRTPEGEPSRLAAVELRFTVVGGSGEVRVGVRELAENDDDGGPR